MNRALLLLVDGLRNDLANEELAAGKLPNLARLTATGSRTRAVTVFPSTTSVAYIPFLTGCFPGRANVPSIRWIDQGHYRGRWWRDRAAVRSYCGYQAGMLDSDLSPDTKTIFELVPESVAIFSMVTRGLDPSANKIPGARKFWGTISHYTENHQPGDDAVSAELAKQMATDWRFCFAQFPAVDGHSHAEHPAAGRVRESLRAVDSTVGRLIELLRERSLLEDTLIMLVSDHGAAAVHDHLDLAVWFRERGAKTLAHPVLWTRNPEVAVMVAGNAQAAVYANPGSGQTGRLDFDRLSQPGALGVAGNAVELLLAEEAVALLAAEDGRGGVRVASHRGDATLNRDQETIRYQRRGGDPLDLGEDLALTVQDWAARSIDGPFPDAAVQLVDQFDSPRTGDIVMAAAAGWDFRDAWENPAHKAGHGSLIAEHMLTPLWSNQPLPERTWRTVDVFPRILEWLGERVPTGIDGR